MDYKQRIHIDAGMFTAALTDWTLVITEQMVSELAQDNWILDPDGLAKADLGDLRVYLDSASNVQTAFDIRAFQKDSTQANRKIEMGVNIPLTDPVAGNDIWIVAGDPALNTLDVNDTYGQYNTYDDDFIASYCFCDDPATGIITDRTRNQRHASLYKGTGVADPLRVDGASGGKAWQFAKGVDTSNVGSAAQYVYPSEASYSNFTVETVSKLTQTTNINDASSYFSFSTVINGSGLGSIQAGRRNSASDALTVWGTDNSGNTYVSPQPYYPDLSWHYISLIVSNGNVNLDYDGTGTYLFNLLLPGVNTIYLGINRNRNSLRSLAATYDQVSYHSVVRNSNWRTSVRLNHLNGAALMTGEDYVPALGAVIPYSGNEADYEAFNSVGGGFFKGGNSAYFDLGRSLAVPATVDVSIRFKYRKAASAFFAILGNGIYNSEAVEVDFSGSLQFRAPTGGGSTQVVAMNAKTDSLWHEYQIDYNQAANTISTYKDGSPVTLNHVANFNGGVWDWSFLLRRTSTSQVFVDEIAFIEIEVGGVVEHYFDFGLANAAGDAGPDAVWDLVGGIHGDGVNTADSNWSRTANLPNNLRNGFNLYSLEPNFPVPASLNSPGFDPFGVAIEYSNPIPSGGVVDYDTLVSISKALLGTKPYDTAIAISKALTFLRDYDAHVAISKAIQGTKPYDTKVEIFSAGVTVKQYDTSITINKLLAFMLSYDTRVTISKAYYNQKDYDTIVTITKIIDQVRGYDTEVSISKTLQNDKDYDTIVRAIRDSKVPLEVIHKANLRMADRILYRNLRIASKDEYKRLRIH
jgi:hypothetical protein